MKQTVEEFLKRRKESRPSYVFDLRGVEEYESGHIMGSHNLPLEFLEANLHRLPFTGDLLLYDGGEGQGARAAEILTENGFSDFYHVEEGFEALKKTLAARPDLDLRMACSGSDTQEVKREVIQNLLDYEINPMVASHGGTFTLVNVEGNKVIVELGGGCQGCGMVDVTLRQGVETRMREVFPDMEALVDITQHSEGTAPFVAPGQ